jgi:hypothetical protein
VSQGSSFYLFSRYRASLEEIVIYSSFDVDFRSLNVIAYEPQVHTALGLSFTLGTATVVAHLTPRKEKVWAFIHLNVDQFELTFAFFFCYEMSPIGND